MEPYAVVATQPVLPPAPPPARSRRWPLAALALVVVVGAGAFFLTRSSGTPVAAAVPDPGGPFALAAPDRPAGTALPLTVTWTVGGAFTVRLPAAPDVGEPGPTSSGTTNLMSTGFSTGPDFAGLVLSRVDGGPRSPRASLAEVRLDRVGAVRSTRVGSDDAAAQDFTTGGGSTLREYRFVHGGVHYAAAVLARDLSGTGASTALAALQSIRFPAS